jgi:phosphoribosylamine--glycine ligase
MLALAERETVDLTVVGPEAILERGTADLFREHGRPILGPSRAAAALEWSKAFSKYFMARHGIPTARFRVCETYEQAHSALNLPEFRPPVVVKADGLAAGKGVVVAESVGEAEAAIKAAMIDRQFGEAGAIVVLEECLTGPEVSFFTLCDGIRAIPLGTAQDHKRIFDGDRGPNTGGMGAFSPSPLIGEADAAAIMARIVQPVMDGMRTEGAPYIGFLYVGLMLTVDGPKVIEFNARFGDPEAQVVLPRLRGGFARALLAAATGNLHDVTLITAPDAMVGVVMASRGYPASAESGRVITGLDSAVRAGALVFHSGTRATQGGIATAGGRVLTVVGRGSRFEDAMATAYEAVHQIQFDGMQFRSDIGRKAIKGS